MHMLLTLAETAPAAGAQAGMTGAIIALVTLTAMEIVLGIDNIVFIAILCARLPEKERNKARRIGLIAAMVMRIILLCFVGWIASLTKPWATFNILPVLHVELSGRT